MTTDDAIKNILSKFDIEVLIEPACVKSNTCLLLVAAWRQGLNYNAAFQKLASQSSTQSKDEDGNTFEASKGTDGVIESRDIGNCFQTKPTEDSESTCWWKVDLKHLHVVGRIELFNCNQNVDRLRGFKLEIFRKGNAVPVWVYQDNLEGPLPDIYVVDVPAIRGDAVKITNMSGEHLHLAEVEVYALDAAPAPAPAPADAAPADAAPAPAKAEGGGRRGRRGRGRGPRNQPFTH